MNQGANKNGLKCPVCGKSVGIELLANKGPFPFCCERCKMVDLGNWLDSDYKIPVDEQSIDDMSE